MTTAQSTRRPRSSPEDEPARIAIARVATRRAGPRLGAAIWLVGAFVVVAVLKPWGWGGPIAATLRPDVAVPIEATPDASEDRSATALATAMCLGAGAWRVASLETWRHHDVRVWRAIEPVTRGTGPLDPAIPAVPIVADAITGLGWCAPAFGPDQPTGPARVRAWLVADGIARSVTLRQVQPEDGITPIAAMYLPASGPWTTGLVVFQYADTGTGWSGWFAADLRILGPVSPSAPATPAAP
jgi:hypothetical protein